MSRVYDMFHPLIQRNNSNEFQMCATAQLLFLRRFDRNGMALERIALAREDLVDDCRALARLIAVHKIGDITHAVEFMRATKSDSRNAHNC